MPILLCCMETSHKETNLETAILFEFWSELISTQEVFCVTVKSEDYFSNTILKNGIANTFCKVLLTTAKILPNEIS